MRNTEQKKLVAVKLLCYLVEFLFMNYNVPVPFQFIINGVCPIGGGREVHYFVHYTLSRRSVCVVLRKQHVTRLI